MFEINRNQNVICYACGVELDIEEGQKISRMEECPACKRNLRCCRMCIMYDVMAYNECHEMNAERMLDKERANYCSYFVVARKNVNLENDRAAKLSAAEALFRK